MADRCENLIFKSESCEFMDQPCVQHQHVVMIPPVTNASNIASSSPTAVDYQTLNSPSIVPHEGVPTDVSTSGFANLQGGQGLAPRRQRSRRNNPCSWLTFGFICTIIQIILLVVFLFVFRDEHPLVTLRVWTIGYGVGCLAVLPLFYCSYKCSREQSNRLPQTISNVSPSSEVDERDTGGRLRFRKILKWLWTLLYGFFVLWFGFGIAIVFTPGAFRQAPHLNRLCIVFLFILFIFFNLRLMLPWMINIVMRFHVVLLQERPQGASANVISELPTYKFHVHETLNQANKEEDDVKVSIGGDERIGAPAVEVVECCICLDPYEDGVMVKELPCVHYFHVKCIDQWLKINGSCPTCKREVGTSMEPTLMTVPV